MLTDVGVDMRMIVLCTDAAAAKGIANRRGLGKVRHMKLCELWLQSQVARGRIRVRKIKGEDNFSDSLTKKSSADRIAQTFRCTNQTVTHGRHELMPNVAE